MPGNSQAKVARALGVRKPSVHAWYARRSRPRPHLRRPLEELTKGHVPAGSWFTASELEAEREALATIRADPADPGQESA